VNVIDHHREGKAIDSEAGRKFLQSILDPSPAMFERFSGDGIHSTKPRAANGSLNGMKSPNLIGIENIATILSSHDNPPELMAAKWAHSAKRYLR